jgi:hypothetical protein
MRGAHTVGSVHVTVTGVAGMSARPGPNANREARMSGAGKRPTQAASDRFKDVPSSAIPSQRNAADAYRVTEDQVHRARIVVARNAEDSEDCRELLDMLGLISSSPDQAPPVRR